MSSVEELDELILIERNSVGKTYNILQLRHHATLLSLMDKIKSPRRDKKYDIELTYVTLRGPWYAQSWKGDPRKSFGIAANIGVHFFDMFHFIFVIPPKLRHNFSVDINNRWIPRSLKMQRGRWFLSIDGKDLPNEVKKTQSTFRNISIDGSQIEFSDNFTDLHTTSYRNILTNRGIGLEAARQAIQTTKIIRNLKLPFRRMLIHW